MRQRCLKKCGTVKGRLVLHINEKCPKCIIERFKVYVARRKTRAYKPLGKAKFCYSRNPSASNRHRLMECQQRFDKLTEEIKKEMEDFFKEIGLSDECERSEVMAADI
ncbi:MAG: hypothetical protein M1816_007243 [Peltula sp. TS41687]|nr:MAG: hypothetical protein M1816_007243 [Peltula sp. TS41687]